VESYTNQISVVCVLVLDDKIIKKVDNFKKVVIYVSVRVSKGWSEGGAYWTATDEVCEMLTGMLHCLQY